MDWIDLKTRAKSFLRNYKYVAIVFFAGLFLMLLPSKKTEVINQDNGTIEMIKTESLQDSLGSLLSSVEGAGKVKVLLTQAQGERTIYQTDTQERENELLEDTVVVSGAGKEQLGLIKQILPPKYQGAIILCQGADKATVRLAIVEAVSNATGLSTDRISVLKMK